MSYVQEVRKTVFSSFFNAHSPRQYGRPKDLSGGCHISGCLLGISHMRYIHDGGGGETPPFALGIMAAPPRGNPRGKDGISGWHS